MKALSLTQPMALAVFNGKDVENRTWPTKFRGRIGEVDIVDCVRGHGSRWAFPDQWNWVLANPELYDLAIPYKGRLGLFEIDTEEVEKSKEYLQSFRV